MLTVGLAVTALAVAFAAPQAPPSAPAPARIEIDVDRTVGEVDPPRF